MPCEKRLASCDQKPLILHVYKDRCSYQDITLWFLNAFCFLSVHILQELQLPLDYLKDFNHYCAQCPQKGPHPNCALCRGHICQARCR